MLSFDIRALESKAAVVDGELTPTDPIWEEGDPLPEGSVAVTGRLSAAGPGRFYFSGHIAGSALGECRRCLTDVHTSVAADAHFIFAEEGLDDADDESDAFPFDPGDRLLDLRPAVREEWLLAVPAFPVCREECQGLCPRCGADLNLGPCDCPPVVDDRWEELRDALGGVRGDGPASD